MRDFQTFLLARYKLSTAKAHFTRVRAMYNHAYGLGLVNHNPTSGLTKLWPRQADIEPKVLLADELRSLVQAVTSIREKIAHVLESQWHSRLSKRIVTDLFRDLFDRAGLTVEHLGTNQTSHLFRKSLSTDLARRGAPDVIDSLFGWAPATVRSRYYTARVDADMHEAIGNAYATEHIIPEQAEFAAKTLQAEPSASGSGLRCSKPRIATSNSRLKPLRSENEDGRNGAEVSCQCAFGCSINADLFFQEDE
jgi:integrase